MSLDAGASATAATEVRADQLRVQLDSGVDDPALGFRHPLGMPSELVRPRHLTTPVYLYYRCTQMYFEKEENVEPVDLTQLELMSNFPGLRVNFPVHSGTAPQRVGRRLLRSRSGRVPADTHRQLRGDLLVLAGEGEAWIGDETSPIAEGQIALIPAMAPHGIRNIGSEVLRGRLLRRIDGRARSRRLPRGRRCS